MHLQMKWEVLQERISVLRCAHIYKARELIIYIHIVTVNLFYVARAKFNLALYSEVDQDYLVSSFATNHPEFGGIFTPG